MSSEDVAYYRSRAREERKLAEQAAGAEAAKAHAELAKGYEILVKRAELLPKERGKAARRQP